MRAFLAVVVGLIGWIVALFVISLVGGEQPVPHGGLLAVLIGILVGVGWYLRGWYPNRTL